MSSTWTADDINDLVFEVHCQTVLKVTIVACTTFHLYYTALHFDEEVEYIWLKKWTTGKAMYLSTRYLGSLFLICCTVAFIDFRWEGTLNLIASIFGGVLNNGFFATCFHGELFAGPGPMIILLAEVILQMRVYALYGRNRKMLIFFILLNVALFGFNILQFSNLFLYAESGGCPDGGCFQKRDLVRRGFIPDDPEVRLGCSLTVQITGVAWGVTSFVEFILFVLVFVKAQAWKICIRKKGTTGDGAPRVRDITTTMARGSVSYFAIIFTICFFTSFCTSFYMTYYSQFFYFMYIESNALETIVVTIMTNLVPKLILNLRAEYYGPIRMEEVELTWNVAGLDELMSRRQEHSDHSEALASFLD